MLHTSVIVYYAIDQFLSLCHMPGAAGKIPAGFEEFSIALAHAKVPCVWITSRTRAQMDALLRKLDHGQPFIAEGGSAVYLPIDYFHLRGEKSERRGRFLCIPVARSQPAAAEALESLSKETGVAVVPLQSLSPRELAQNSGLPRREAELARQRDFDELFFFAGASDRDIRRFREEAQRRRLQLRPRGVLWSLAVGASVPQCVRELTKLFDRSLRGHAPTLGIAPPDQADELFPVCDRNLLLVLGNAQSRGKPPAAPTQGSRIKRIDLHGPDAWDEVLAQITTEN